MSPDSVARDPLARWAKVSCALALLVHAALAWGAAARKSPTYDETADLFAAWAYVSQGDLRAAYQPPLSLILSGTPLLLDPPAIPLEGPLWESALQEPFDWQLYVDALYRTPGVDGPALVRRGRAGMLTASLALLALLAWLGWKLGGPLAGCVAAWFYALDPSFLGHGPLIKEDVLLTLGLVALALTLLRLGERVTPAGVALAGLAGAVCLGAKMSGVIIVGPVVLATLTLRALLPPPWAPGPWRVGARALDRRGPKLALALALTLTVGVVAWLGLWSLYGFRFAPTPDPASRLRLTGEPDDSGGAKLVEAVFEGLEQAALLPQQVTTNVRFFTRLRERFVFLDGEVRRGSFPSYYPRAMLYKLPLATWLALLGVAFLALDRLRRGDGAPQVRWPLVCAGVVAVLYGAAAQSSGTNLGVRHVFPVYALVFPCLGWGAAEAWRRLGRRGLAAVGALASALALTTALTFPDYLAFFNAAVGGPRGGIHRLGDSNLDWGQDLTTLARWRVANPAGTLYLCYFGSCDPHAYGLDYVNLPGGFEWGVRPYRTPEEPGVIAISATHLQGIYLDQTLRDYYAPLLQRPPRAVLGGTIYVFDYPGR